nr:MAG TPA_asm: hypothetical protein [Caudoviricetes sp.]DAL50615.1 MAG TPA_asm: hypothetical protein [Caudoviricetes sp.]
MEGSCCDKQGEDMVCSCQRWQAVRSTAKR